MPDPREIERLRKDASHCRRLAAHLLHAACESDWTDWELDFLESIATRCNHSQFTYRQTEKLIELREANERVTEINGRTVTLMIEACWLARLDLSEDDEAFITKLHAQLYSSNSDRIHRRTALRLAMIARQLDGELADVA